MFLIDEYIRLTPSTCFWNEFLDPIMFGICVIFLPLIIWWYLLDVISNIMDIITFNAFIVFPLWGMKKREKILLTPST